MTEYISEFDDQGFEKPFPAEACSSRVRECSTPCEGPVHTRYSRSGMTSTLRCEAHEYAHQQVLDGIANRYPDTPHAPAWFDESYAGERWDDDY